jgi:hypothetical protein
VDFVTLFGFCNSVWRSKTLILSTGDENADASGQHQNRQSFKNQVLHDICHAACVMDGTGVCLKGAA